MYINCDFEEYTTGFVKNEEDRITRKKYPPLRILKTRAKKKDRELIYNINTEIALMREYTEEELKIMGKFIIDTSKKIAYISKCTKSFTQRRFRNKHSKSFKRKFFR